MFSPWNWTDAAQYAYLFTGLPTSGSSSDAGVGEQGPQDHSRNPQDKQGQDQRAILALFSITSSRLCTDLEASFGGSNQGMLGRVLLCWTP